MSKKNALTVAIPKANELMSPEEASLVSKEIVNVREEVRDCPYLGEALRVLTVKGYRSAIGSYWNAVIDDIRQKVMHRSLDLFNKEASPKRKIEKYEDFQDHITDHDLIEGAYKIGVLSWEARKMMHQARETRNLFDGHPNSSDPGLLKVLNLISDCNKYILSEEYPPSIIDISAYLNLMDSADFSRNHFAVEQAFVDLPSVYKSELSNRLYSAYISESISTNLRGNIEFCAPILWSALTKDDKKQIGKRFDKEMLDGDQNKIQRATSYIQLVNGMMYVGRASRKVIVEPLINSLSEELDNWDRESELVKQLEPFAPFVPTDLRHKFVEAITRTYVGYKGSSYNYSRQNFFSNGAAPYIKEMFESFDAETTDHFVDVVKTDSTLRRRIAERGQLERLRVLGNILLESEIATPEAAKFLAQLCDEDKTEELFTKVLPKIKK